jgi:transposase-like protein
VQAGKHRSHRREYDPVIDPMLTRWAARNHLTLDEAAKRVGVPARQLRQWVRQYPEMRAAIDAAERNADAEVIQALFDRATGVDVEDSHSSIEKKDGQGTKKKVKQGKRHLPGNIRAIMFWLRNRLPEQWGDRPDAPAPMEIIARIRPVPEIKLRQIATEGTARLSSPEPEDTESNSGI